MLACVLLSLGCSRAPGPKLNDEVKVEPTAAPSARASASALMPRDVPSAVALPACVLSDREWRHVTLWPSVAGLEAYHRPRDPSPQVLLRMRGERGAFHVAHDGQSFARLAGDAPPCTAADAGGIVCA